MSDISDLPNPVRSKTLSYYLVLAAVLAFYAVIYSSWAFVAYTFSYGLPVQTWWMQALFCWSCLEVLFSFYHFYLAIAIQAYKPSQSEELNRHPSVFLHILETGRSGSKEPLAPDDPEAIDFRYRMRTWFRKAPWSDVTREGMLALLSWTCFELRLDEALRSPSRADKLHQMLDLVEKRSGTILPSGRMKAVPLRLTMDHVDIWSKPLLLYASINLANWVVERWLCSWCGCRKGSYDSMEYFIRMPADWTPEKGRKEPFSAAPVIFVHGLGVGLIEYLPFLWHLFRTSRSHPIVIPYLPHISYDLWHPRFFKPMGRKENVEALVGLIKEMEFGPNQNEEGTMEGGVVFISHSNGSITHAWMMKDHPVLLRRSCFVDPVAFNLWEGDVCYNFVYRSPVTGMELAMWYFVGAELGNANLLRRHFVWSSNMLWFEEVKNLLNPMDSLFLLGRHDRIADTERLRDLLHGHGVRKGLVYDLHGGHGTAILGGGEGVDTIIDWLNGEWVPAG